MRNVLQNWIVPSLFMLTGCTAAPDMLADEVEPNSPGPPSYQDEDGPPGCDCDPNPTDCCCDTPIILDLAGDGIKLTSWKEGVTDFQLVPWRPMVPRAWTERDTDDAFLTLDRNGDYVVTNGFELFGSSTPQLEPTGGKEKNGFLALAQHDDNADQIIDNKDIVYEELRLWQDRNHDGISQPDELLTLTEAGVAGLSVVHEEHHIPDGLGNLFRWSAPVIPLPGATVDMMAWDVSLSSPNKNERRRYGIVPIPVPVPFLEESASALPAEGTTGPALAGDTPCFYARHIYDPYTSGSQIATQGFWDWSTTLRPLCRAEQARVRMRLRNKWQGAWYYVADKTNTVIPTISVFAKAPCHQTGPSEYQAWMQTSLVGAGYPIDLGIFDAISMTIDKQCNSLQPPDPCD